MKILLPITLGALLAAAATTSVFAQCSHGYKSADMSNLTIAADSQKTEEAMSSYDPSKANSLLEKPAEDVKTAE